MDLNGLASPVVDSVNPNVAVTVQASVGYSNTGPGLRQVPAYADPISGFAQVQALSNSELRQAQGLNIQGAIRKIYIRGALYGVIRPQLKGGDLIGIGDDVWLVVMTLELWPTWTSAMIVLQEPRTFPIPPGPFPPPPSPYLAYNETPGGTIDGNNKVFTLAHTPTGFLLLMLNGLYQFQPSDYSLSGNTITMVDAPESGDSLVASLYEY